jgi:GTP cyclohydrolase I
MDRDKMEAGIRLFLEGMGEFVVGPEIEKTPRRVARAWAEDLVSGYGVDPSTELTYVAAPAGGGPVIVKDIRFSSVCVHHLLPFSGVAHIAYLPAARLAGLSKLGRAVDALSRRLQIQEHLTAGIASAIEKALAPRAVLVVLDAEHTCMTLRGVRKEGSRLVTYAARGAWADDSASRREILDIFEA